MDQQFVSRGGLKLQEALKQFKLKIENDTVLDVGSSTGGFVDCLLQGGAAKVYALDTAYGELSWKLRNDPRVIVMERTNILHLKEFPERVDLVTIDSGWTKLELVLPVIKELLRDKGIIVALLKPHYEIEDKKKLVKGVVPECIVEDIKDQVLEKIKRLGFVIEGVIDSPVLGGGGNKEFLVLLKRS